MHFEYFLNHKNYERLFKKMFILKKIETHTANLTGSVESEIPTETGVLYYWILTLCDNRCAFQSVHHCPIVISHQMHANRFTNCDAITSSRFSIPSCYFVGSVGYYPSSISKPLFSLKNQTSSHSHM